MLPVASRARALVVVGHEVLCFQIRSSEQRVALLLPEDWNLNPVLQHDSVDFVLAQALVIREQLPHSQKWRLSINLNDASRCECCRRYEVPRKASIRNRRPIQTNFWRLHVILQVKGKFSVTDHHTSSPHAPPSRGPHAHGHQVVLGPSTNSNPVASPRSIRVPLPIVCGATRS